MPWEDGLLEFAGNVHFALYGNQLVVILGGLAEFRDNLQGLVHGDFKVLKINGFRQEIKGAAVHGGADVPEIAVSRDDHGLEQFIAFIETHEKGQPVHFRHVDIGQHDADFGVFMQFFKGLNAIAGKDEFIFAIPYLAAEFLSHKEFQIGFVVNKEDFNTHGPGFHLIKRMRMYCATQGKSLFHAWTTSPHSIEFP